MFAVAPGFAIIFYFNNALFIKLETFKLLFLSLSLVAPFLLSNFAFLSLLISKIKPRGGVEDDFWIFVISAFNTSLVLFASLFLAFLLDLGFETTFYVALFGLFAVIVFFGLSFRQKKTREG